MHLHLDPVGGIAGDMFAAALLDVWPHLEPELEAALDSAGIGDIVSVARRAHHDGVLTGSRFEVTPTAVERERHDHGHEHAHRRYADVCRLVGEADLPPGVRARALDIFRRLGEAEAAVHGVALEAVHFHEVGAWDSIADVVSAAWLIEAVAAGSWSCASVPLGRGRVRTAHGELAIPVPATTRLLQGLAVHDDGREGERVTPTGAAILRHLDASDAPPPGPMRLLASGAGFGSRRLQGMSNVLRVLAFEPAADGARDETVGVCNFELDDQSPEDLALALDRLRAMPDVLDVSQTPIVGKRGRLGMRVQVLTREAGLDAVIAACFDETSTLGVRWQTVRRRRLSRECYAREAEGHRVRIKQTRRPDGAVTRKAEIADLASAGARSAREALRRQVETAPAAGAGDDDG